jgi:putative transposase
VIKGKPPRLPFIYLDRPVFFLTFCTLHRRATLDNHRIHEQFRSYCIRALDYNVAVGRYVVMPDHIHLFVCGDLEFDLGIWVRGLKRVVTPERNCWQPGFFDHLLRSVESYAQKWEYVRENPVRAGLVQRAEQWPFQGEIVLIDRV